MNDLYLIRDRGDVAAAIAEILAEEDLAAVSGDVSELDPACGAFDEEEKIARVVDFFASFGFAAITEADWRCVRRAYAAELAAAAVLASE